MSKEKIQVVILAGGKGSRLHPYTKVLPKPLVPLGESPIVEILIRQLKYYGFKNIVMATGHLAELIESYFGDGRRWGVNIRYVRESRPLGTAGVIRLVNDLKDDFLLVNGDTLTSMDFRKLMAFHKKAKGSATVTVKERTVKTDFGVVEFDQNNLLTDYREKPEYRSHVSIGVNMLHRECRDLIKRNEFLGLPDLLLRLRQAGKKVFCHTIKDIWLDLGRPDDLVMAEEFFRKNQRKFPFIGR